MRLPARFAALGEEDEGPVLDGFLAARGTTAAQLVVTTPAGLDVERCMLDAGLQAGDVDALRRRLLHRSAVVRNAGCRAYNRRMPGSVSRTWVLTSSPDNHEATAALGFTVIGIKERNRARALQMEPGDRVVLYLTKVMRFAAAITITGELYEDRAKIWPGKPGKADAYPWRFATEPELVLEEPEWLAAETLKDDLAHIRKWPPEHWKLAFQGQLRTFDEADAALLMERMRQAAGVAAA